MGVDIHFDLLQRLYTGSSHQFQIDPFQDRILFDFLVQGRREILKLAGSERLTQVAASYVHNVLFCNGLVPEEKLRLNEQIYQDHYKAGTVPFLGDLFKSPICRETNIGAHLLLAQLGISSEFVSGYISGLQGHGWVEITDRDEVVDAVIGKAGGRGAYYSRIVDISGRREIFAMPHAATEPPSSVSGLELRIE